MSDDGGFQSRDPREDVAEQERQRKADEEMRRQLREAQKKREEES
jgi:hypothetical protein